MPGFGNRSKFEVLNDLAPNIWYSIWCGVVIGLIVCRATHGNCYAAKSNFIAQILDFFFYGFSLYREIRCMCR